MTICVICGTPLVRRYSEAVAVYAARRTCSIACGNEWKRLIAEEAGRWRRRIESVVLKRLARRPRPGSLGAGSPECTDA